MRSFGRCPVLRAYARSLSRFHCLGCPTNWKSCASQRDCVKMLLQNALFVSKAFVERRSKSILLAVTLGGAAVRVCRAAHTMETAQTSRVRAKHRTSAQTSRVRAKFVQTASFVSKSALPSSGSKTSRTCEKNKRCQTSRVRAKSRASCTGAFVCFSLLLALLGLPRPPPPVPAPQREKQ